jgi:hypothetical protein
MRRAPPGRRARAAAEQLSSEGVPIRYVHTTYLPDDETCFHHFEARTPAAVEEASRRAALGRARIVPAIEVSRRLRCVERWQDRGRLEQ